MQLAPREATATTVMPPDAQEILEDAGFVGVVECEEAGCIVATFKVVESWFGPPAGTQFRIRFWVNPSSTIPYALCSQRFLVAPRRLSPAESNKAEPSISNDPLTWRIIPADYDLEVWGYQRLPLEKTDRPLSGFGTDARDLAEFRKAVRDTIGANAQEREILLLRRYSDSLLFGETEEAQKKLSPELAEVRRRIHQGDNAEEMVRELLSVSAQPVIAAHLSDVLGRAGGPATLKVLEGLPAERFPGGEEGITWTLSRVRRRLGVDQPEQPGEVEPDSVNSDRHLFTPLRGKALSAEEVAQLRKGFIAEPTERVFATLVVYDPAFAVDFMLKGERNWHARSTLGFVFGHYCVKDRAQHLRALLDGKDPLTRVAAAVYLRFDDPVEGTAKLREFMKIKGDAGAWAALTLARHGDKSAVPRLLDFFGDRLPRLLYDSALDWSEERDFLWLRTRIRVLLSNSAKASGVDQPREPEPGPEFDTVDSNEAFQKVLHDYQRKVRDYYLDWWKRNGDRIQLYDPWVDTLDKQRID